MKLARALLLAVILGSPSGLCKSADEPTPPVESETGAVMLEDIVKFTVSSSTDSRCTYKQRIRILNEDGKAYCHVALTESDFAKILDLEGAVYDQTGRQISELKNGDISKKRGLGSGTEYSNYTVSFFSLSAREYPFEIEYQYTVRLKSLFFWPDWSPQRNIPVTLARYELDVPAGLQFRLRTIGEAPPPTITQVKDRHQYLWTAENIPAFEPEPYMPPQSCYQMSVQFAPSDYRFDEYDIAGVTWSALSSSSFEMYREAFKLSDDQISLIENVRGATTDDSLRAETLYNRILKRTRYVAIETGIGGWRPVQSSRTFGYGYGDCKGLATLQTSMLRYAGIPARLCLLTTRDRQTVDPDFASLGWFNHVILFMVVKGDTIWADPTCQDCALGDLPSMDENLYALVIDSAGGPLISTPRSSSDENVILRKVTLTIDDDKSTAADLEVCAQGNPNQDLQRLIKAGNEEERVSLAKSRFWGFGEGFAIVRIDVSAPCSHGDSKAMRITASIDKYVHKVTGKAYVNPSVISLLTMAEDADLQHRKYPLNLGYPLTLIDTIVVTLPSGDRIIEIPADSSFEDQFGSLKIGWKLVGNQIFYTREKTQTRYQIEPGEIEEYIAHRTRIRNAMKTYIVFGGN